MNRFIGSKFTNFSNFFYLFHFLGHSNYLRHSIDVNLNFVRDDDILDDMYMYWETAMANIEHSLISSETEVDVSFKTEYDYQVTMPECK